MISFLRIWCPYRVLFTTMLSPLSWCDINLNLREGIIRTIEWHVNIEEPLDIISSFIKRQSLWYSRVPTKNSVVHALFFHVTSAFDLQNGPIFRHRSQFEGRKYFHFRRNMFMHRSCIYPANGEFRRSFFFIFVEIAGRFRRSTLKDTRNINHWCCLSSNSPL